MSRVGKQPVAIPAGVTATIAGNAVRIAGPRGDLEFVPRRGVKVANEESKIVVSTDGSSKQAQSDYGTTRSIINNMVLGVTKGWKRSLEMSGVGFTAKLTGDSLVLACGFSHDVTLQVPKGIKCTISKSTIELEASDKEAVGTFAAKIRKVQPPEPYLGKGIRFTEETVRRKAGKTGKK